MSPRRRRFQSSRKKLRGRRASRNSMRVEHLAPKISRHQPFEEASKSNSTPVTNPAQATDRLHPPQLRTRWAAMLDVLPAIEFGIAQVTIAPCRIAALHRKLRRQIAAAPITEVASSSAVARPRRRRAPTSPRREWRLGRIHRDTASVAGRTTRRRRVSPESAPTNTVSAVWLARSTPTR